MANQIIIVSIQYIAACWSPYVRMCDQMKGLVKNIYLGWKIKKDMCEGQMGHDYTFGLQRRAKVH